MRTTPTPASVLEQGRPVLPGKILTRRAVTAITAIVVVTFAFSLANKQLCLDLGITAWVAWLVGPAAGSAGEQREENVKQEENQTIPAAAQPPVLPPVLLARTRELDTEHRAVTGRPISRDNLRAQLRIGRDRASALVAAVRAEAAAQEPGALPQAA